MCVLIQSMIQMWQMEVRLKKKNYFNIQITKTPKARYTNKTGVSSSGPGGPVSSFSSAVPSLGLVDVPEQETKSPDCA